MECIIWYIAKVNSGEWDLKKGKGKSYISKIKLNKNLHKNHDLLTVFLEDKPILNFKIAEEPNN